MKRGTTCRAALLIIPVVFGAVILAVHGPGMRIALAAEPGTPQPAPQATQALPAPSRTGRGSLPAEQPRSISGMAGMPGMRGPTTTKAEQIPLRQPTMGPGSAQSPQNQPMAPMGGMGAMSTRTMVQGLTMREVLYILSIQDALQVMAELLAIQEKLIAGPKELDREHLRRELARIKEQVRRITGDYREVMSGHFRGE